MTTTQGRWDAEKATEEALAFLQSEELGHYSSRRIKSGHEKLEESAVAGLAILEAQGQSILSVFAESEKARHKPKQ